MWWVGVTLLTIVAVGLGQVLARRDQSAKIELLWDIPRTAGTYTSIVAMLAGFTAVVTMFFANLTVARSSPEFETVLGMLLLAFVLFIAAAMQFGTTPNLADRQDAGYLLLQRFSYQVANTGFFCGLATSWMALKLFLDAMQLPSLASVFTWVLFAALFTGSFRMAQYLVRSTTLTKSACLLTPFVAFGLASLFRVALVRWFPGSLPGEPEPFLIAVCLFAVGFLGFVLQSTFVTGGVGERSVRSLERVSDRLMLGHLQAVTCLSASLWLSV